MGGPEKDEIFLGRGRQLEDFGRALFKFLEGPELERPQIVLISGQGGIGKSTLLRKLLQVAEQSYPERYHPLHVDWQVQKHLALRDLLFDDQRRGWLADREVRNQHEEERKAILLWNSAEVLFREERHEEALEALRKAAAIASSLGEKVAKVALQISYPFYHAKDYSTSRGSIELAIKADPQNSRAWLELGSHYGLHKDYEKAIEYLRNAVDLDPEDAASWWSLATIYGWQKDYGKAIEYHRKALNLNPEDTASWRSLGNDYSLLKSYEKANEYYRKALDLDPEDAGSWSWYGRTLAIQGKAEMAVDAFERSISIGGRKVFRTLIYWGDLLNRQGQYEPALEKYRSALAENQESGRAYVSLIALLRLMNESVDPSWDAKLKMIIERDLYEDLDALEAQRLALNGETEAALENLAERIEETPAIAVHARFYAAFHDLRADPRFIEITEDAPQATWDDFSDS